MNSKSKPKQWASYTIISASFKDKTFQPKVDPKMLDLTWLAKQKELTPEIQKILDFINSLDNPEVKMNYYGDGLEIAYRNKISEKNALVEKYTAVLKEAWLKQKQKS